MKKDWIIGLTALALMAALLIAVLNKPQPVAVAPNDHQLTAESPNLHAHPRSPEWPKVRAEYLEKHPACEACGSDKGIQVHHVKDFHTHPELELNPENFITLCGPEGHNCHLRIGHNFRFDCEANPNVREDAAQQLKRIKEIKCD